MPYKSERFVPGDLIRSDWANKIEDELLSKSSFIGSFSTYIDLPNSLLLEDGSWQVVQDEKTIYVVKDKQWQKKQVRIELQGDIVGTGIEHNNAVILNTTQVVAQNLVKSIQITGDVQGTSAVENGVATVYTAIPNKINSIQLTGEVNGFAQITSPDVVIQTSTNIGNVVKTDGSVPEAMSGYETQRPEPGKQGRIYVQHDTRTIYYDTGTDWKAIAYQPGYITVQYTPPSGQLTISGVFYLYTEKSGSTYNVHVINSTANNMENQIVTMPTQDLEITSTTESLRIGFGYPYYIEQLSQNKNVVGNVVIFSIPMIPANSEITIPVEKVPGFAPDRAAFFFNSPIPTFDRSSGAYDISLAIYSQNALVPVKYASDHKPRYISNYILVERSTRNLLWEDYAKLTNPQTNIQHPNVFSINSSFTLRQEEPYPGYKSVEAADGSIRAITKPGSSYVASILTSGTAGTYFSANRVNAYSKAQLAQVEEGVMPTTWVPVGFQRQSENLFIENIASKLPVTGWSIEQLIAPTEQTNCTILLVGNNTKYIKVELRVENFQNAFVVLYTVNNGSTVIRETSTSFGVTLYHYPTFQGVHVKLAAYENGLIVAKVGNNTVSTTLTQPVQFTGNLYIATDPFSPERQGSLLIKNLMITNNPNHNQLQNQWQTDSSVLYFVPFEGHTLPTVVRI